MRSHESEAPRGIIAELRAALDAVPPDEPRNYLRQSLQLLVPLFRRGLTPLIYSHISPYGTFLLDMRPRLDLEQPEESAQARPEYGAAPAIGRAVRLPRRARAQVQQLGLFNAAPEPHH